MTQWWMWPVIALAVAAPVWWVLKEWGVVSICPIREFAAQSARTYRKLRGL
jgi:predicted CDP-diglyceride synthetase/phosphatidate cytidylyltransferase